jgi:GNAT superfamily N-acetyltransferase
MNMSTQIQQHHSTDGDEPFDSLKGHLCEISPLAQSDKAELEAFIARLSPRTRRLRFFSAVSRLSPSLLEHLMRVDFRERAAFVVRLRGSPKIQAVGRYELTGPGVAEVAFAVADEYQHEGIGTELLHHLAFHARANGIRTFSAYVLWENREMFELFRHSGYPMWSQANAGVTEVTLSLSNEETSPSGSSGNP